jgi:hypothetical protein
MANARVKSMYQTVLAKALAWGALALSISAGPLMAQDTIGGNFTLHESARFGETVLGPGQYKFSIEPVGIIQSLLSIQQGVGHMVLVVVRPEKSGTSTSMFAMASPLKHASATNELILEPEKTGTLATTMNLEREGLMVDFRWASPKPKVPAVAQQIGPNVAVARSGGNN